MAAGGNSAKNRDPASSMQSPPRSWATGRLARRSMPPRDENGAAFAAKRTPKGKARGNTQLMHGLFSAGGLGPEQQVSWRPRLQRG